MFNLKVIFTLALVASISALENETSTESEELKFEEKMAHYRLPNNTAPNFYRINLEPNMDDVNLTWSGKSSIDFEVFNITRIVTLHAFSNLVIDESFTIVIDNKGGRYKPMKHIREEEVEFLKLEFDQDLNIGNYSLNIKYSGIEGRVGLGFFRTKEKDDSFVAGTHFEATTARRAFPCWDEPGLKAEYLLSIKHYANYTAISNMPEVERKETGDGKILTTFGKTPKMSIYLLTFVISNFGNVSNEFGNVTVWAPTGDLENYRFLLNLSQEVVDFMEEYTGLSYGFPRIGSVILPIYPASATEHWGLVTYRYDRINRPELQSSFHELRGRDLTIAHELTHSWFGNHVTPRWWNDLWLNEGFATYFSQIVLDKINGFSGDSGLFVTENNDAITRSVDAFGWSVNVRFNPITNTEIRWMFFATTYKKGAAVLHMFRYVLSDDVFQVGIRSYLKKYTLKAVETPDLLNELQLAYDSSDKANTPLNLTETITPWLMQTGTPLINVTRNYTTGEILITQQSFQQERAQEDSKRWWVPLNFATKTNPIFSSTMPSHWMSDKENNITIGGIDKNDWVIFNLQTTGHYRVTYDDENWRRIIDYMNTDQYKNIHILNRAQLMNDLYTFAKAEPERYAPYLWQLMHYLSREEDYLPWHVVINIVQDNLFILEGTEYHNQFLEFIVRLSDAVVKKYGYEVHENDDYLTRMFKSRVLRQLCAVGHRGCVQFSVEKLSLFLEDPVKNQLHPDHKFAVLCAGLQGLNYTKAKRIADLMLVHARETMIYSLGCTADHEIHRHVLSELANNSKDENEIYEALRSIHSSRRDTNFNFFLDLYVTSIESNGTRNETLGIRSNVILSEMHSVAQQAVTSDRLARYQDVLNNHYPANGTDVLNREWALNNAEWKINQTLAVVQVFETLGYKKYFLDNSINKE